MKYPEILNENAARLTAFFTLLLSLALVFFPPHEYFISLLVLAFLTLGFFLRTIFGPNYEPTAILTAKVLLPLLKVPEKPTNALPKRFAQSIGLSFCLLGWLFFLLEKFLAFKLLFGILSFFAFLEAFFNFCAGCFMFNQMVRLRLLPKSVCEECENISQRLAQRAQKSS